MLKEVIKFMRTGQLHRIEIGRAINVETFSPMIEIKVQKMKAMEHPCIRPEVEEKTYTISLEHMEDRHVLIGEKDVDDYIANLEQQIINFK